MGKVYTDKGGIKLMDYLLLKTDKPWFNYYMINPRQ